MLLNGKRLPAVTLTIAGFDPTGGAGVIADIKTFAALGCYGVAATTAITVQDTVKVYQATPLSPELITNQLLKLFFDLQIAAVKIGMLGGVENVLAVAELLDRYRPLPIVLDPLIYSSSGYPLTSPEARQTICEKLFPLATIITPNLNEAALLSGETVVDIATMKNAADRLHAMGARAVLVKGGHLSDGITDEATDLFYDGNDFHLFPTARLKQNAHGTGCALSAAIAAALTETDNVVTAIGRAKRFITEALRHAQPLGKGVALLDHFSGFNSGF